MVEFNGPYSLAFVLKSPMDELHFTTVNSGKIVMKFMSIVRGDLPMLGAT